MDVYHLLSAIDIFVFLFESAGIFDKWTEHDVEYSLCLFAAWFGVCRKVNFSLAESFIYLADLIRIVIYFSHGIAIKGHIFGEPINNRFGSLTFLIALKEESKEIS